MIGCWSLHTSLLIASGLWKRLFNQYVLLSLALQIMILEKYEREGVCQPRQGCWVVSFPIVPQLVKAWPYSHFELSTTFQWMTLGFFTSGPSSDM